MTQFMTQVELKDLTRISVLFAEHLSKNYDPSKKDNQWKNIKNKKEYSTKEIWNKFIKTKEYISFNNNNNNNNN